MICLGWAATLKRRLVCFPKWELNEVKLKNLLKVSNRLNSINDNLSTSHIFVKHIFR